MNEIPYNKQFIDHKDILEVSNSLKKKINYHRCICKKI